MQFLHPFTGIISGPTGCGKSKWCIELITNVTTMISPPISNIVYSYSEWQDDFATLKSVKFVEGIVPMSYCKDNTLLIIDDQMNDVGKHIADIFTKGSHHRNISVIFIVQNLFHQNKYMRTITLNAHYIVLFKSPRDKSSVNVLASQMYPGNVLFFKQVYADATKNPYSYLLIDLKQNTPDCLRLRTDIFPGDQTHVYVDKRDCLDKISLL